MSFQFSTSRRLSEFLSYQQKDGQGVEGEHHKVEENDLTGAILGFLHILSIISLNL